MYNIADTKLKVNMYFCPRIQIDPCIEIYIRVYGGLTSIS